MRPRAPLAAVVVVVALLASAAAPAAGAALAPDGGAADVAGPGVADAPQVGVDDPSQASVDDAALLDGPDAAQPRVDDPSLAGVDDPSLAGVDDPSLAGVDDASLVGLADVPDPGAARQQVDPDAVVLRFGLRPDGDAAATVEYRVRLADENDTAAFEDLQADVRANRSAYEARFADRMGRTVESAENATGRPMALRNVSVETGRSFGGEYGVVTYRFEWTGFAAANGTHLVAGDALAGLFLDGETRLFVGWPAEYRRLDVAPPPDDARPSAVVWTGPLEFAPGEPRVVLTSEPPATATPTATPTDTSGPTGTAGGGVRPGTAALVALAVVVLVAALAALAWWRRGATDAGESDGDGDADEPPPELLSNEERVLQLLDQEGGRVKQQEIVSVLDWTEAKTSQVVGDLREEGSVEVFRIGRENVVTLPDEEL